MNLLDVATFGAYTIKIETILIILAIWFLFFRGKSDKKSDKSPFRSSFESKKESFNSRPSFTSRESGPSFSARESSPFERSEYVSRQSSFEETRLSPEELRKRREEIMNRDREEKRQNYLEALRNRSK